MSIPGVSILAGVGVSALEPLPPVVMNALERVDIVTAIGERGSFQLTFGLEPGSALPERFLLDSGDLVRLVLIVGEVDDRTVAMDGVIVRHTMSTRATVTAPVLVVAGEDLTILMDLTDTVATSFSGMPLEGRVQVMLDAYLVFGMTPRVVPPPIQDVPLPTDRIPHRRGTDYDYVRLLAACVGHQFTLDPGPTPGGSITYWGPEPRGDRSRPSLVIEMGRLSDVETLHLRFDAVRRVQPEALLLDPVSKALIPIPVPDIAVLAPPLGAAVPPAQRHRRARETAKATPGQAAATLLAEAARSAEAMTGVGRLTITRGRPRLRAGAIVEVRGASPPFNGLFAVNRVRDRITAGGYRQVFELLRAGLGATRTTA